MENINRPLVSVIMSFFNNEETLRNSVDSVMNQSYSNIELLLVDNCSTDGSTGIALEYNKKYDNVIYFKTEQNSGGPAVPRNIGIDFAKGEYLAFIDSDDVWKDNKLNRQLKKICDYNLVCSVVNIYDEDQGILIESKIKNDLIFSISELIMRNYIVHSSVMVKKNLFINIKFDEDELINGLEDYSAYMKYLSLYGKALRISEPLVEYRRVSTSLGGKIVAKERLVKSIYCLSRSMINLSMYNHFVIGVLSRLVIHFKNSLKRLIK